MSCSLIYGEDFLNGDYEVLYFQSSNGYHLVFYTTGADSTGAPTYGLMSASAKTALNLQGLEVTAFKGPSSSVSLNITATAATSSATVVSVTTADANATPWTGSGAYSTTSLAVVAGALAEAYPPASAQALKLCNGTASREKIILLVAALTVIAAVCVFLFIYLNKKKHP